MSHGLRITNPSGTLVFDSTAPGYSYRGQASMQSAGYNENDAFLRPYVFQWTAPDGMYRPLPALRVTEYTVARITLVGNAGGNSWLFYVQSIALPLTEPVRDISVAAPALDIFYPGAQSGSHGLRLFRADGTVGYDVSRTPLFIEGVATFPYRDHVVREGASTGDPLASAGDAASIGYGFGGLAVLGDPSGFAERLNSLSGEVDETYDYGWTWGSGQLKRVRFNTYDKAVDGGSTGTPVEAYQATLNSTKALLVDTSTLV